MISWAIRRNGWRRISHAINIRIRELDDEEGDAYKSKEKASSEKEDGRDIEDQHAEPQAVQLPEAYTYPEMIKDYGELHLK